jgi:hypothetical protein
VTALADSLVIRAKELEKEYNNSNPASPHTHTTPASQEAAQKKKEASK